MTLIDKFVSDCGKKIYFYQEIDIDFAKSHPKDGTGGLICFFVKNIKNEINKFNRNVKLDSILNDKSPEKFNFNLLQNQFVTIFQTDDLPIVDVYLSVRDRYIKEGKIDHYNYPTAESA